MIATPALPPPAIEQPAARQISYGLVTGRAARGTVRVLVHANGIPLASRPLAGRRFTLRVTLPRGDVTVRVTTVGRTGRRSSAHVHRVFGLPPGSRPRAVASRLDTPLARTLTRMVRGYRGTAGYYVQSLSGGSGAAWNAKARFPAASTLKLAIAATVLAEHSGIPPPGSYVDGLLRELIVPSDDEAANSLLVWLDGSTSAGAYRVNGLMRSIGLTDSLMYGGYQITRALSAPIPRRVDEAPSFGVGKYTTAWDMTSLWRALWLASGGVGPLRSSRPGLTPADARYLLWLTAHVRDQPKLDTFVGRDREVDVLHKAGWISSARHDTGLVFWEGGVFVAGVMTYRSWGVSTSSDRLAGRVAAAALQRFRRIEG
ncbi:MAG TPA: serine hydrolase [Gaiellaceae bacterium]|nr:serine hydrolase [Gaiellaceae bacterium]